MTNQDRRTAQYSHPDPDVQRILDKMREAEPRGCVRRWDFREDGTVGFVEERGLVR